MKTVISKKTLLLFVFGIITLLITITPKKTQASVTRYGYESYDFYQQRYMCDCQYWYARQCFCVTED